MKVLSVAAEVFPLVKTGGLADVVGALPDALASEGVQTQVLVPGYPAVLSKLTGAVEAHDYADLFGGPARILASRHGTLDALVLDAPHLYRRDGGIYGWPDDARRFAALSRAAADIGLGLLPGFVPDIVHAHDWQTGLTAAYLAFDGRRRPGTVFTIHNLAFQGQFPANILASLGLPARAYSMEGVEYYGEIGYLKAGAQLSDRVTTVSPTYANEVCGPEHGMGMDGLLRYRGTNFRGILNGIDTAIWDPATDPLIAARYSAERAAGRAANRRVLQSRLDLDDDPARTIFGVITRLSWQKGIDLIFDRIPALIAMGGQLALLGAGDQAYEDVCRRLSTVYPGSVGCLVGYDEGLAHLIQAGSDALLVPSRFEPCGLTQLCALRYGAIPVVARVGGLADTVIDANPVAVAAGVATGVQFNANSADGFEIALRRTVALHRDPRLWQQLQRNAMATDVSWRGPAARYAELYRSIRAA